MSFHRLPRFSLTLPAVILVASNLVPLVGVLAWGWQVFDVVVLYWFENVVLGVINILKMMFCAPDVEKLNLEGKRSGRQDEVDPDQLAMAQGMNSEQGGKLIGLHHASKLFFIPFFTVHYGIFTLVHGVFVFSILGDGDSIMTPSGTPFGEMGVMVDEVFDGNLKWAALALAGSHFFSFCYNFFYKGEFRKTVLPKLMIAPYGRVVVLHFAILGGAFAVQALGSPVFLLVILIIGKIMIDLGLHFRSHQKLGVKG